MAGLIACYDTANHRYLRVSRDEKLGRHVGIIRCDAGENGEMLETETALPDEAPGHHKAPQFSYSLDNATWHAVGPEFDGRNDPLGRLP